MKIRPARSAGSATSRNTAAGAHSTTTSASAASAGSVTTGTGRASAAMRRSARADVARADGDQLQSGNAPVEPARERAANGAKAANSDRELRWPPHPSPLSALVAIGPDSGPARLGSQAPPGKATRRGPRT